MPFNYEKRLQQERLDEYYLNKKRIQEHHNKKIQLDKLMLEKYWEKIAMLQTYNRQTTNQVQTKLHYSCS